MASMTHTRAHKWAPVSLPGRGDLANLAFPVGCRAIT